MLRTITPSFTHWFRKNSYRSFSLFSKTRKKHSNISFVLKQCCFFCFFLI